MDWESRMEASQQMKKVRTRERSEGLEKVADFGDRNVVNWRIVRKLGDSEKKWDSVALRKKISPGKGWPAPGQ
jgi:hypothetical protein